MPVWLLLHAAVWNWSGYCASSSRVVTAAVPAPREWPTINATAGHAFRPYGHAFTLSPLAWDRNAAPFGCLEKKRWP